METASEEIAAHGLGEGKKTACDFDDKHLSGELSERAENVQ